MSQPTTHRPPQVSLASGIVMFSSVVVLLTVWERVSSLGSLETQEGIRDVLADAPFDSLGLTVSSTTDLLRISCMIAAACACATAILGWYVRKPDRSARLGLTLFAVPVFVTGIPAGGLAGSFVAAGAAMLWMQPGREWFATGRWTPPEPAKDKDKGKDKDGRAGRDAAGRTPWGGQGASGPADPWGQPPVPPPGGGTDRPPPATRPFGEPAPDRQQQPVGAPTESPYGQPYPQPHPHPQPHPQAQPQPATRPQPGSRPPEQVDWQRRQLLLARPAAMVAAFVLTVVAAGGVLVVCLMTLAISGLSPELLESLAEQERADAFDGGVTVAELRGTVLLFSGIAVVWCAVALTFAGFAMARREWARRGLLFCAAFSAGAAIAFAFNTLVVLVPAAAAVATVVCLRRVEVRRWFSLDAR